MFKHLWRALFPKPLSLGDIVSIWNDVHFRGEIKQLSFPCKTVKVTICRAKDITLIGTDIWLHMSQVK